MLVLGLGLVLALDIKALALASGASTWFGLGVINGKAKMTKCTVNC